MDISKFTDLYKEIMQKYSWQSMIDDFECKVRHPKYVRFCLDTRDGDIWSATADVEDGTGEKIFRLDSEEGIEEFHKWLNKEEE